MAGAAAAAGVRLLEGKRLRRQRRPVVEAQVERRKGQLSHTAAELRGKLVELAPRLDVRRPHGIRQARRHDCRLAVVEQQQHVAWPAKHRAFEAVAGEPRHVAVSVSGGAIRPNALGANRVRVPRDRRSLCRVTTAAHQGRAETNTVAIQHRPHQLVLVLLHQLDALVSH